MDQHAHIEFLEALAYAFDTGGTIDPAAYPVPEFVEAYALQQALYERTGKPVAGFKLALNDKGVFSAPMFFVNDETEHGFMAGMGIEVELALTLGSDLPPKQDPYSRDEIVAAIETVGLGIELIRSRYASAPAFPQGLADFLSNVGYVLGPKLPGDVLSQHATPGTVTVKADGVVLHNEAAKHPNGDPLAALIAYANAEPGPFGPLKAGQVITTGSLCGAVRPPVPADVLAITLGANEIALSLKA